MKTTFKLFLVFFLGASFVFAQGKKAHHGKHHRMSAEKRIEIFTEFLTEKLELNPEQQSKVKSILKEEAPKIKEIHKKYPGKENKEMRRKLKRPIMQETAEAIRKVLEKEQREKFNAMIPGWRKEARKWYKEKHKEEYHGEDEGAEQDEE